MVKQGTGADERDGVKSLREESSVGTKKGLDSSESK